jgi:uncharacterized protein YecE (DUF72 family)
MGEIFVGTSGFHYEHWRGTFYPEALPARRWLEYYVDHFPCVEINGSFYGLPRPATVARWVEQSPPGFRFALKAWQQITHRKKLKDAGPAVAAFFQAIEGFGEAAGPILFQLPPRFGQDLPRLEEFFELLPEGYRYAFEFRDPSWHSPELRRLLERHGAAFCIYELAGFSSPLWASSDLIYVRLHGPSASAYAGDYSPRTLRRWAEQAAAWRAEGREVWIFFDNDQAGYAAKNALELLEMVGERPYASPP